MKLATTVVAAVIVSVQVPVPSQGPAPQPVNVDPVEAVAVNLIAVPLANPAEHVAPQLIPAGLLVTVPVPVPALVTVRITLLLTLKVAVTASAALIVTEQVPVPVQPSPLQPANVDPVAAAAVSTTTCPLVKLAEHVAPQLIPAGLLVTVPVPVPALLTVSVKLVTVVLNVAVTASAALIVTEQVLVPVQPAPDQPIKFDPSAGNAVSTTTAPLVKLAEHVVPQLIPAGLLVTVPVPVPALLTVKVKLLVVVLKVAVTPSAALMVTEHVPVPVQPAPLQPANVEPVAAAAVSTTTCPLVKLAEHVAPQLIPAGLLVTVPVPVPALRTVRVSLLPVLKVAVTVTSDVTIGTTHVGGFVWGLAGTQFALNPANVDPAAAVAVSVTLLLSEKDARQLDGQLMPLGVLVTVPVPEPISVTIKLFVPTSFSPNTANPTAEPDGVVNDVIWVPLAISKL